MAETIVSWVLNKLGDAVVKEALHLYGVNEQVDKVSRELTRIQAFLKDSDRKPIKYERQKNWVKEYRDIAYSIEDVIDTFLMDIPEIPQNPQKSGICETITNKLRKTETLAAVHNLVNEINKIHEKMKVIEESRVRYGINNLGEGSGDIKLPVRPLILPDIDPDIVGFKADQDYIVKKLLDETTKRRSVVSICGTGGLEKTTIAQKVYNCEIIGTSYEDLPFALKLCFMYFAAFPKDYSIDAESLLRMWIAEGFIPPEDNRSLEETAESFLEDLVRRSMIQVDSRSYVGAIKTIHIHDLLRDLAIQKAKEENFLLVYSNPNEKMSLSGARRVAIHNSDCGQLIMSPNLRTLLCFHEGSMPNCSKQKLLKVVRNEENEENIIELEMFEGLTQLRYLGLVGRLSDNCNQEFFEEVIGRMKYLQTLEVYCLRGNLSHSFEFPKSAWNIKTLRHVFDSDLELPASVKLTNLQTIGNVRATQSWEMELPHIPNLRSLRLIARSSPSKSIVTFLSTLKHLANLQIYLDDSVLDILDMRGFPFYNHLQSLTFDLYRRHPTKLTQVLLEDMLPCYLIYLYITDYKFQQDIMPVLEKLHCLKVLTLVGAFESQKTTCSSGGFSQLEVLHLYSLSIEEWEIEDGAMPILKQLDIYVCRELGVPQGLRYLTNLQKLKWEDVGDSRANLVRNLCQHVPSIDLGHLSDDEFTSDDE